MQRLAQPKFQIVLAVNGDAGLYMKEILESQGYSVFKAAEGRACWLAYQSYHPALVILEQNLHGMDGLDVCRRIRGVGDKTPILAFVQQGRDNEYEKVLEAGATDCYVPPMSSLLLTRRVANLMQESRSITKPNRNSESLSASIQQKTMTDTDTDHRFDGTTRSGDDEANGALNNAEKPEPLSIPESEHRYRQLFNAANDAITIIDMQTRRFLDVNRLATRWLGYSREELLEMPFDQVHVPLEESDQRMVETGLSVTGRLIYRQSYKRKDGSHFPVEVSSRMINYDGRRAFLNVARDLTDRQEMERRLQEYAQELEIAVAERTAELSQANTDLEEQREQLLTVITGANCLLWSSTVTLQAGEFQWETRVYSEEAARRFLSVDLQPGKSYVQAWRESMVPEDQVRVMQTAHNALKNNYTSYPQEYRCRLSDGQVRWLYEEVRVKPLGEGQWGLVGVSTDITERKRSAEMLKRAKEDLEQAVAQRTAELIQVNHSLRQEIEVRQHAEKAVSESEARFRALVEHAPEAIVVFDVTTEKFVDVNQNAITLFEATVGEVLRSGPTDFSPAVQPDGQTSISAMRQHIRAAVDGKTPVFEWLYQPKSGQRIPCEVRLLLLPTTGNLMVRGSITDITDRKRIQQAEEQQKLVSQALRESAADLSRTLELDEVYDRIIEHIQKVMSPLESVSLSLLSNDAMSVEVIRYQRDSEYDKSQVPEHIKLSDVQTLEWMLNHKQAIAIPDTDNSALWSQRPAISHWVKSYVAAPIITIGQVVGFIGLSSSEVNAFNEDHASRLMIFANQAAIAIQNARLYAEIWHSATQLQRKVAESRAELETERVRLNAILNALTEGVLFTDVNWNTVYVNRPMEELTRYSDEELNSPSVMATLMSLPPDYAGTLQNMIMAELQESGIWRYNAVVKRKDESEFHGSLIATQVNSARGKMLGTVTVLRDISEEKRLESQKAQFIANASHELRTPIANMKTRLYLMRRQPEKLEENLQIAEIVTDRMRRLVEALLDLSRFEHGQIPVTRRLTQLQPLILEVFTLQAPEAEKRTQTLSHELPSEPLYAQVDSLRFSQVITNLVTNAIHYTLDGGQIRISLRTEMAMMPVATDEEMETNPDAQREPILTALIGVHDNGPGIPTRILPNIFKPFVRGSELSNGVGLGLAITQEIVELHKGLITVESSPETGTSFYVRLALANANDSDIDSEESEDG